MPVMKVMELGEVAKHARGIGQVGEPKIIKKEIAKYAKSGKQLVGEAKVDREGEEQQGMVGEVEKFEDEVVNQNRQYF